MKSRWIYIKGFFLLVLVAFLVSFSHYRNRRQKIKETQIYFKGDDNLFMTFAMVDSLLKQNAKVVKNQLKTRVDLFELEHKIKKHPLVKEAEVSTTIDGVLEVDIQQRKPIARVVGKQPYYIDEEAKKMPLSPNHSARVLTVFGSVKKENYKEIHQLVTKILSDNFLKKQIISVERWPNGTYQLIPRVGNHSILLGNITTLHQKLMNLKMFYAKAIKDSIIDKYSQINLQYNHQVVCTKK